MEDKSKPIIYSCSGSSSAAQLANYAAVKIDRSGDAEMSCIAGVGGNVKKLVRVATSGRKIIAVDGCPLACVKHSLAKHNVTPTVHVQLAEYGVKKIQHEDFDMDQAKELIEELKLKISEM